MLPYWEDEPTAIGDAVDHVVAKWRYVAQAFPGKPVMIGEAGWPSAGRMR
jgi:exo-beta-1,3-glucanase (GH17 family)